MTGTNAVVWCCFESESFSDDTTEYYVVTSFNSEHAALDWVSDNPLTRTYAKVVLTSKV